MLLVIIIFGILATVVILAVGDTTTNAAKQACIVEARDFQTAVNAASANTPPVSIDGNKPKTDAAALASQNLLRSPTLKYLADQAGGQALEWGNYPTGWTYAAKRVDYSNCA
jgi:type II secretory pathway pseudopilin PulG